ncbi:MAG TPA: hypothetical protein VFQ19_12710 [Nocardioidaceae bacterium]|nr:hypothetical protein [Nocardioidaceae bacterium]
MIIAAPLVPVHLGDLHAYETVLLAILAFGPFVVLAVVVYIIRRRDLADEAADEHSAKPPGEDG